MPVQALPQEILNRLVDCAKDDLASLKGLALTSPRFLRQAQSHMYRTLRITGCVSEAQRSILKFNPFLLKHVRRFHLVDVDFTAPPSHALGSADRQITLSSLVDELQDLEWLYIIPDARQSWKDASPLIQSIVKKLLLHPLRYLSLTSFRDIPSDLVFPLITATVETWKVNNTTFKSTSMPATVPEDASLCIKSLVCQSDSLASVAHLLRAAPFRRPALANLVNLHLGMKSGGEEHLHSIGLVQQGSRHLKRLTLEYTPLAFSSSYESIMNNRLTLTLPAIPNLRSLHLLVCPFPLIRTNNRIPTEVPQFLHALLSVNNQPALELMELRIGWVASMRSPLVAPVEGGPCEGDGAWSFFSREDWAPMDEVLSNGWMYPNLKALVFDPHPDLQYCLRGWHQMSRGERQAFTDLVHTAFRAQAISCMRVTSKKLPFLGLRSEATTEVGYNL